MFKFLIKTILLLIFLAIVGLIVLELKYPEVVNITEIPAQIIRSG